MYNSQLQLPVDLLFPRDHPGAILSITPCDWPSPQNKRSVKLEADKEQPLSQPCSAEGPAFAILTASELMICRYSARSCTWAHTVLCITTVKPPQSIVPTWYFSAMRARAFGRILMWFCRRSRGKIQNQLLKCAVSQPWKPWDVT